MKLGLTECIGDRVEDSMFSFSGGENWGPGVKRSVLSQLESVEDLQWKEAPWNLVSALQSMVQNGHPLMMERDTVLLNPAINFFSSPQLLLIALLNK
jgi:hypothetical protein